MAQPILLIPAQLFVERAFERDDVPGAKRKAAVVATTLAGPFAEVVAVRTGILGVILAMSRLRQDPTPYGAQTGSKQWIRRDRPSRRSSGSFQVVENRSRPAGTSCQGPRDG